jgi:hypothetical protein
MISWSTSPWKVRDSQGFCRKFCSEDHEGQLPLAVRRLRSESVALLGRRAALFPSLNRHLFFLEPVHAFEPN